MNKLIRVILSLDPTGFAAGILTANNAVQLLQTAINALKSAFGELQKVIAGAAEEEKMNFQLGVLMGNTQLAAEYFDNLQQHVEGWGVVLDDIKPSVQQLALGLKQVDGAVDPDKLTRYTDIVLQLSHVTGQSVDDISTAIRRAITTGDLGVLQRGLGINVETMKGLSEETQRVLQSMNQAQETQLGAVTKVGGGVKPTSDQILKALEEVTTKLGGSKEALEEYGQSWEGQINTLKDLFDQLKDTFGQAFIDEMLPALREFTQYLIDHKEEILAFVKRMAEFTAEGLIDMADALAKLDWNQIAHTAELLIKLTGSDKQASTAALTELTGGKGIGGETGNIVGKTYEAVMGENSLSRLGGAAVRGDISPEDAMKAWITANLPNLAAMNNVNVTVTMDDEGKFKAFVEKTATKKVGEIVDAASKKPGGSKDNNTTRGGS